MAGWGDASAGECGPSGEDFGSGKNVLVSGRHLDYLEDNSSQYGVRIKAALASLAKGKLRRVCHTAEAWGTT